jgi:hypothetical protein
VIGQPTEPRCTGFLAGPVQRPHIGGMNLELNDVQIEALLRELSQDRAERSLPLSPRIVALKENLGAAAPGSRTRALAAAGRAAAGHHH